MRFGVAVSLASRPSTHAPSVGPSLCSSEPQVGTGGESRGGEVLAAAVGLAAWSQDGWGEVGERPACSGQLGQVERGGN